MASRRVAKSAVDWVAFAERVPAQQREAFRSFKAHAESFVAKVHRYPENIPAIDFAHYSSRLSNPAMVSDFEKAYKALSIPYPKDKDNVKAAIDADEKKALEASKEYIAHLQKEIDDAKTMLDKVKSLPPVDEMTEEMYTDYFPQFTNNPTRPTFFPHTKSYQPQNDPHAFP